MEYPKWFDEAEQLFVNEKKCFTEIGRILNVNRKLVSYYLRSKGYTAIYKTHPKTKVVQKHQKALNENIFETIDTYDKAYWLGFLYADGSVSEKINRIELSLKEEDYNHLLKYKAFIGSDHVISKRTKMIGDKTYIGYRLSFNSAKMKQDLIKHGCIPNKTKIVTFPKLRHSLIRHFIRGYFDGDGCIRKGSTSKMTIEILGTEPFLKSITDYFNIEGHIYGFKHSDIKRFVIAGPKAQEIMKHLYNRSQTYLDRKYEHYKLLCRLEPNTTEDSR